MYSVDQAGVELIASFEGFVDGVYNDSEGYATCGYGHLLHYSPATEADHREFDGRGRAFYLKLLALDIKRDATDPMNHFLHVSLNQNQVNAVASACFNCGPGFVEGSVGNAINAENWRLAANDFMLWAKPAVLTARRQAEARLFLTPVKGAFPWLTAEERRIVEEYDKLHNHRQNPGRQRVLRTVMLGIRKTIWRAAEAEKNGWDIRSRRQRYQTLLVRTS
jgi:GH24 family phage-related lysozyme (muramidase)